MGTGQVADLFTIMAASSMIQLEPITMGPAMAKMVALGWTIVPVIVKPGRSVLRLIPEPTVMSPFSSTSWHTMAFECIVNLSRIGAIHVAEAKIHSVDNCLYELTIARQRHFSIITEKPDRMVL